MEEHSVEFSPKTPFVREKHGCLHASRAPFRFVLLFFNCMITFGSYFCYDMPSVLQTQFTSDLHPNKSGNCSTIDGLPRHPVLIRNGSANCTSGLGLNNTQFNLLYSIYAWTNALVVILAGFLIDKLGNTVGALLFSSLCLAGTSVFAAGVYFKDSPDVMFPILLLGRIIFGTGNGSLTIVQNRISAMWFKKKELAFAFGCTLAFSRMGSVMNFYLTDDFEAKYGLQMTLWGGVILCAFSLSCAFIVCFLDLTGTKQLNRKTEQEMDSKRMRFTDIKYFSSTFWLLCGTLMFFYNGVFPFIADASTFIKTNYKDTFHFTAQEASYVAGSVYFVSMVFGPVMGIVVDNFGRRGILCLLCSLSTIPVYGFLAFAPNVHPLVSTLWLGLNYSVAAASLWPSIPLVVSQATIGTALGVVTSIQMIGIGICNLIVGKMLDVIHEHRWKYVMIFLLANTLAGVTFGILLNITDYRKGGVLNRSTKQKREDEADGVPANYPVNKDDINYLERDALLYDSTASVN